MFGEQVLFGILCLQNEGSCFFEPIITRPFAGLDLFLDLDFAIEQRIFLLNIGFFVESTFQMKIKKFVELLLNRGLLLNQRTDRCLIVLTCVTTFFVELCEHRHRPVIRQCGLFDDCFHLCKYISVTEIFFLTRSHLLRAAIVDVFSVTLGSDGGLAGTAVHATREEEFVFALAFLLRFSSHHCLHTVEEVFGDDRLVRALEEFAQAGNHSVVTGILEHALKTGNSDHIAFVTAQAIFTHGQSYIVQGVIPCRIQLKRFTDEWRLVGINVDSVTLEIVEIPNWCQSRPLASA